jgi:hypothetical protein
LHARSQGRNPPQGTGLFDIRLAINGRLLQQSGNKNSQPGKGRANFLWRATLSWLRFERQALMNARYRLSKEQIKSKILLILIFKILFKRAPFE